MLDSSGNTNFDYIYQDSSGNLRPSDVTYILDTAYAFDANQKRANFKIEQALYPSKLSNVTSLTNIINFSATRYNALAGEGYIPLSSTPPNNIGNPSVYKDANNNYLRHGYFTAALDAAFLHLARLNTENTINTFTVEQFYILITGFINDKEQIPVCTTSQISGPWGVNGNTIGVLSSTPFSAWFNNIGNAASLNVENPNLRQNVLLRLLGMSK